MFAIEVQKNVVFDQRQAPPAKQASPPSGRLQNVCINILNQNYRNEVHFLVNFPKKIMIPLSNQKFLVFVRVFISDNNSHCFSSQLMPNTSQNTHIYIPDLHILEFSAGVDRKFGHLTTANLECSGLKFKLVWVKCPKFSATTAENSIYICTYICVGSGHY